MRTTDLTKYQHLPNVRRLLVGDLSLKAAHTHLVQNAHTVSEHKHNRLFAVSFSVLTTDTPTMDRRNAEHFIAAMSDIMCEEFQHDDAERSVIEQHDEATKSVLGWRFHIEAPNTWKTENA